eukprot:403333540
MKQDSNDNEKEQSLLFDDHSFKSIEYNQPSRYDRSLKRMGKESKEFQMDINQTVIDHSTVKSDISFISSGVTRGLFPQTEGDDSSKFDYDNLTQIPTAIEDSTYEPRRVTLKSKREQTRLQKMKCWPMTRFFCRYQWRDLKRHKFHFCLAFCSVLTIVLSTLVVVSIIGKGPVIFMKMAEGNHGQVDAFILPRFEDSTTDLYQSTFLNYTSILEQVGGEDEYNISPRKTYCSSLMSKYTNPNNNHNDKLQSDSKLQEDVYTNNSRSGSGEGTASLFEIYESNKARSKKNKNQEKSFLTESEEDSYSRPLNPLPSRDEIYNTNNSRSSYGDFEEKVKQKHKLGQNYPSRVCLDVTKLEREQQINVGSDFNLPELRYGECYVHEQQRQLLGIDLQDKVVISAWVETMFSRLIDNYNNRSLEFGWPPINLGPNYFSQSFIPCTVVGFFWSTNGKYPDGSALNQVMMHYDYFLPLLADYLPQELVNYPYFKVFLKNQSLVTLDEYADHLVMTLPSPRYSWYNSDNIDSIQYYVTHYVNEFITDVGFYNVIAQMPILREMSQYNIAILLFNLIFRIVITIFIIISILLVYSLLMIGIEGKTLETGILRMVGISRVGLTLMIFLQSIMFVLPAIVFGFVLSIPCLVLCYIYVFEEQLNNGFSPIPSWQSFLNAFFVGILIPCLSSIIPIIRVLGQNLNDALNYERNRVKAIYIKILHKSHVDIYPQLIFGIITFCYGFAMYYLLPLSLLSMDLGMILQVFFCILVGLLFGLSLLAINLQKPCEVLLTYLFLLCETRSMRRMVLNNLKAHMMRNRLTSTIFSMALGFIIFLLVAYKLQIQQLTANRLMKMGSYPSLQSYYRHNMDPKFLDVALKNNMDQIESFNWISEDMTDSRQDSGSSLNQLASNSRFDVFNVRAIGVTPQIFDVTGNHWLTKYWEGDSGLKLGEQLYTPRGSQGGITSAYVAERSQTDPSTGDYKTNMYLFKYNDNYQQPQYTKVKPTALLSQSPMFAFNDNQQDEEHPYLISLPLFAHHSGLQSVRQISYDRLVIKMKYGSTSDDQQRLINRIKQQIPDYLGYYIGFFTESDGSLAVVDKIVSLLFDIVIVITMFLCFFSLSSSMSANLYEQAKEIGILRAIGFRKIRIVMLYTYEAFILVVASSLMGIL